MTAPAVDPFAPVRVWRYDPVTLPADEPWIVSWAGWAESHPTWAEAQRAADALATSEALRDDWAAAGSH